MKMKKILAAALAGVMALSATACSSSSTKKIESPDDFAGAKISVQTGTTAHDALQKMQEEGALTSRFSRMKRLRSALMTFRSAVQMPCT